MPWSKQESSEGQYSQSRAKRHKGEACDQWKIARWEEDGWKDARWKKERLEKNSWEVDRWKDQGAKQEKTVPWKHPRKETRGRASEDNDKLEEFGINEDDATTEVADLLEETDPPQIFIVFQEELKVLEQQMKRIQRISGARMEIDKRSSQVEIHGSSKLQERCIELLMAEVSFLKNINGDVLKDQEPSEFDIRSEEVGQVVGWNGQMLREIQNVSWAKLHVDTSGRIKVSGPPKARQKCQDLILDLVSYMADSTGATLKNETPRRTEEIPDAEDSIPRDIRILAHEVGQLLGSGGHRISRIEKKSGGRLQVDKGRNRGKIQIFGSEKEKMRCLELLLHEVSYAKDADGTVLKDDRAAEGMPDFIEEDQDNSSLIIDVPVDEMGMLVGRRGENIKRWQQETGAHLNLIRGVGGKNTGRIEISGSVHSRESILTLMLDTVSFAKQSDGLILKDEPILCMWVKSSEVSKVIGPNGTVMKQIMNSTGVEMRLKNARDMPQGSDEREIKLVGSEEQQKKAMEFILGQVMWARGEDGVLKREDDVEGEATSAYKLWIWEGDASKVVGRSGATLLNITAKTGAHVKIQGREEAQPGSTERMVKIYGEKEQQYQALEMILAEVSWARDDVDVLKNLEDQYGGVGPALTVWLDEVEARRVIGRNGDQLRTIRNETGADIKISDEEDGCEREVKIYGSKEEKENALESILALVTWARGVDGILKEEVQTQETPPAPFSVFGTSRKDGSKPGKVSIRPTKVQTQETPPAPFSVFGVSRDDSKLGKVSPLQGKTFKPSALRRQHKMPNVDAETETENDALEANTDTETGELEASESPWALLGDASFAS